MRNKVIGIIVFMLLITSSTAAVVAWNFKQDHKQNTYQEPLDREYREYGDAPEGLTKIAYPATGVTGAFPTCKGCGPALWIEHNNFGAWFGPAFDFELEGNAGWCPGGFSPYDQDEGYQDGDAGLIIPQPYTINAALNVVPFPGWVGTALGNPGQVAVWGVNVDIFVHNMMPGHPEYLPAYVNVLMDWNQNGAWGNPGEHVLQNFLVPAMYIGLLSALLPPNFTIGPNPGYVWTRFSITESAVPLNWNGSGIFEDGETEDYLLHINETEEGGWYYKPAYANYAPQGMPDFDQKQNQWKSIVDGGNGIANTIAAGDDIQVVPAGGAVNPGGVIVAPGPNCMLNTAPAGDDVAKWAFCGPVAVANCFWWFDSKFDPNGHPGDGVDNFSLVQNYGVGDDHAKTNVPFLIKDLAVKMNTTTKGTTNITDMKNAIQTWLVNKGLSPIFTVKKYNAPNFSFIEDEIERCQDVILLLGFYNATGKLPDQMQMLFGSANDHLQPANWVDYQSFKPTVTRLDAINISLVSAGAPPCDVAINVYNTLNGASLGSSVLNPGVLNVATWVQFHFNPPITLVPNQTYYFDVREVPTPDLNHYEWFYWSLADTYPRGQGWMNNLPFNYDWTFRTEYYPEPSCLKGHFVTCAGVNSNLSKIAISDPELDVQNPAATDHNDAVNVSHDIYSVGVGSPLPTLSYKWWLQNYSSPYNYAVVEQAVIVCPRPYNFPPVYGTPTPLNGSTNNPRSFTWSIPINDPEGNLFSWTIQCSNGQTTSGAGASNGTKSLALSGLAYLTMYKVWVNATDPSPNGSGLSTRKWYTFTTKANQPPIFGTPTPVNSSTNNLLSLSWSIPINDPEGNLFSWTIQCSNGQTTSGAGASNGTKSLALSGLAYLTTYKVWVNATDPTGSNQWTKRWYTFTTKVNNPPVFGTPSPVNGSTGNLLSLTWNIPINDPEGNLFSWTIQCSNGQTTSGAGASNGTKSLALSGLAYFATYKVWVNATDPTGSNLWTKRWYIFTTKGSLPPVLGTPTPANGSISQPLSLTWNIPINDPEGDTFSWTIQCSNGQVNSGTGATNGTKSLALSSLAYSTTYKVWVNATDPTGSGLHTRKWYTFTTQQQPNVPPNKPNKPSGTASGKIKTDYTYTTSTTDPNGDQVYYMWDWGDGTQSNWLGPYNSGVTISTTHKWTVKGSYSIKVKAKDTSAAESNWSDPLPIKMPYSFHNPMLQFLELFFERFPHSFPLLRHLLGW